MGGKIDGDGDGDSWRNPTPSCALAARLCRGLLDLRADFRAEGVTFVFAGAFDDGGRGGAWKTSHAHSRPYPSAALPGPVRDALQLYQETAPVGTLRVLGTPCRRTPPHPSLTPCAL